MNNRISIDPAVCHGKPVLAGTRVLVSMILGALAGGDTVETLLADYPNLSRTDIHAALEFPAELASFDHQALTPDQHTKLADELFQQLDAEEAPKNSEPT